MRPNQPLKRSGSNGPPRPTSMAAATLASTSSSTPALDRGRARLAAPALRVSGDACRVPAAARSRSVAAARVSPDSVDPADPDPPANLPGRGHLLRDHQPGDQHDRHHPGQHRRGTRPDGGQPRPSGPGRRPAARHPAGLADGRAGPARSGRRRARRWSLGSAGGSATEMVGSFGMPSGRPDGATPGRERGKGPGERRAYGPVRRRATPSARTVDKRRGRRSAGPTAASSRARRPGG